MNYIVLLPTTTKSIECLLCKKSIDTKLEHASQCVPEQQKACTVVLLLLWFYSFSLLWFLPFLFGCGLVMFCTISTLYFDNLHTSVCVQEKEASQCITKVMQTNGTWTYKSKQAEQNHTEFLISKIP
jgi:hypothetical protein